MLEVGMSKSEMLDIMGVPDHIYRCTGNSHHTIHFYQPPFLASDGIDIYISDDTISRIIKFR